MLTAVLTAEVRHVAVAVAAASSRCERRAAYRDSAAGLLREQRGATARRWFGAPAIGRAGAAAAAPARMVRSMRASTATSASDSAVPHRAAAAFDAGRAERAGRRAAGIFGRGGGGARAPPPAPAAASKSRDCVQRHRGGGGVRGRVPAGGVAQNWRPPLPARVGVPGRRGTAPPATRGVSEGNGVEELGRKPLRLRK